MLDDSCCAPPPVAAPVLYSVLDFLALLREIRRWALTRHLPFFMFSASFQSTHTHWNNPLGSLIQQLESRSCSEPLFSLHLGMADPREARATGQHAPRPLPAARTPDAGSSAPADAASPPMQPRPQVRLPLGTPKLNQASSPGGEKLGRRQLFPVAFFFLLCIPLFTWLSLHD